MHNSESADDIIVKDRENRDTKPFLQNGFSLFCIDWDKNSIVSQFCSER